MAATISIRLRCMLDGIRGMDDVVGIAARRSGSSATLFIHAAIPLRMNSANPRTAW
jgi:hypothetical protein